MGIEMYDTVTDNRPVRYTSVPIPEGTKTILRCVVGSTVHGTSVDGQDDRDEMAIAIPPPEYVLGLKFWETTVERTQPNGARSGPGDLDLTTHSLRKWCQLAAKGNPTILLPLFVPKVYLVANTEIGDVLRSNRNLFLSKDAGKAFLGYLNEQRRKLEGARGGKHGTRTELVEKYGFDTKYAGHVIRLALQGIELMETWNLRLPMSSADAAFVVAIRTGQFTLKQVLGFATDLTKKLVDAVDDTKLPDHADVAAIDRFLVDSHTAVWRYWQGGPIG